ncbi:protein rotatin homolog [Uranotaenia lowii]|uniref:protein rotatin homolog n=1 Tax=Uranotaenia lowii TaxID=190385 RepID=UPI00247966C7|nr:protein rotatin homolog [Uranotaenia lowii]
MTLVITHDMLSKLTHQIQEIRIRTLHDIENKVKRALWDEQQMELKFSPTSLVKSLIRWFGNVPICEEAAVLELLSLLLTSKYGHEIVNYFTISRLIKELGKVKYLIGSKPELAELVENVVQLVNSFKESEQLRSDYESVAESLASIKIDCIDLTESPNVHSETIPRRGANYYTKCWEIPLPSDKKTLRDLNDSLHPSGNDKDIQHAFNYMVPSINDYPPEFFLQPPYIYHSLIKLLEARKVSVRTIVEMLHRLTVSIQKRIKSLQLTCMYSYENSNTDCDSENIQISVPAFVHELFLLGINCLKEVSDDMDLQDSNKVFNMFHDLIELASTQPLDGFQFQEVRREFGYLCKHFRQSWESNSKCFSMRTKYLVTVNLLSRFLQLAKPNTDSTVELTTADETCFPHHQQYNPNDFETLNSTGHRRALEKNDHSWKHELQVAALDYPMKHIYPSLYEPILEQALKTPNPKLQILLEADEILAPAVTILRQPDSIKDEDLIFTGIEAIETLHLHRSTAMVKRLIKAIGRCCCYFQSNSRLREEAEKLTLRLLAHSDEKVKSAAYDACNGVIKDYISSLDEGAILTHRRTFPKVEGKMSALGIPLTVEILVEVICFGFCSQNTKIQQQAETILLFILNSRAFLLDRWSDLVDIIIPVLPLLQTVAITKQNSTLSRAIITLLHPDSELPSQEQIRGNLRFLFQDSSDIREEALTRILFLLSIDASSQHYSPSIDHIRDTISNDICLLKTKYDIGKHLSTDVYEVATIRPLLDTLEAEGTDPAIRRSALVQLNAMSEDPILCEIIHKANGWAFVLQVLDNALREHHYLDYPDSAVPAIGILAKMCFMVPEFRKFLAENGNVYYLVIRALLINHHLPIFKPDCCSLLFLLLFSDYAVGSGKSISLPTLVAQYRIPFVCEFHWRCSPFHELSYLEEIFVDRADSVEKPIQQQDSILRFSRTCGVECATSRLQMNTANQSFHRSSSDLANLQSYRHVAWQYLRLAFACQWFDAFDNILVNAKKHRTSPMAANAKESVVIDYNLLPPHLMPSKRNDDETVIDLEYNSLAFDRSLRLTATDVNMIRTTHVEEIFKNSLKCIATATSHAEVSVGLAGLASNLSLPMREQILHNSIVKHLKKFILTPPNTLADEKLLIDVIGLLGDLIQIGYENVLVWIVTLLFEQTSIFTQLLKSENCSGELFMKNVDFIKIVLQEALLCENTDVVKLMVNEQDYQMNIKREHNFNLLNKLFETITDRLDNDLHKCDIMKIIALVSLCRVVVQSGLLEFDSKFLNHVINKLCSYMNLIRSITYSGSTIIKNCLIIMSLMLDRMKDIHLKPKHYKVIAIQCSHTNPLIRSCAWNVLAKMAKTLSGAHSIIKECAYLPGGVHACAAKTLLDPEETSLVKESATGLLIALLSHKEEKGCNLHKFMLPHDKANPLNPTNADPLKTILEILKKHRFFEQALESMQTFTTHDEMQLGEFAGVQMVTCDVVKSYSMIFSCLVDLKADLVDFFIEKGCLQRLMYCISNVPLHPSRSALLMVSEISNFLLRCLSYKKDIICEIMSPYQAVIGGIIYLLNGELYGEQSEKLLHEVTVNIMHLLSSLALHKVGNQLITGVLGELKLEPLVLLINKGIANSRKEYQIACLRFLTLLVLTSDVNIIPTSEFQSFLGLIETIQLEMIEGNRKKSSISTVPGAGELRRIKSLQRLKYEPEDFCSLEDEDSENRDPNGQKKLTGNSAKSKAKEVETAASGSEVLFFTLVEQFQIVGAKDKPENGALISTVQKRTLYSTIQVMLKQSEKARKVARKKKFLEILLDRLEAVCSGINTSYQDFVRKNGDSKKAPIVEELSSIADIIAAWFEHDLLVHQNNINRLCKMFLQLWPWIGNNQELEVAFIKALVCLTENSIIVCKSFTVSFPGHPHSILKLVIATVTAETVKVKGIKSDLSLLRLSLRVLINCISSQEGRLLVSKLNVLDNINKLHPAVTKLQKPWIAVTLLWLEFWEIYSRHNDVNEVRHLTVLGALIRKSTPELRLLALEIMRNMSYVPSNRPALLASQDFMCTVKSVLDGENCSEQLIVASSIWKMIANNYKGKSAIKNSAIPRRLSALLKQRSLKERCEDDELFNVLNVVVKLLNS